MKIIRWFLRLIGVKPKETHLSDPAAQAFAASLAKNLSALDQTHRKKPAAAPAASPSRRKPSLSAAEILRRVLELERTGAAWPEIFASLNPDKDPLADHLLNDLRGPHLFSPHVALNVLRAGCQQALQFEPNADRMTALRAAIKEWQRVQ